MRYEEPTLEIIIFGVEDVISTSTGGGPFSGEDEEF